MPGDRRAKLGPRGPVARQGVWHRLHDLEVGLEEVREQVPGVRREQGARAREGEAGEVSEGEGYQGECKVCGWRGEHHENHADADAEAAEHAGYCAASREPGPEPVKPEEEEAGSPGQDIFVDPNGPLLMFAKPEAGSEHDWMEGKLLRMIDAVYLTKPLSLTEILFGGAEPTGRGSIRLGDMVPDLPEDIADLDAIVDVEGDVLHFPGMTHEQWERFRALACEESEGA